MSLNTTAAAANIPLDMMFEPTGILLKDYNAYCEVDGLLERDDLIDAVSYAEFTDPISGQKKLRTRLNLRNPPRNNLLPQRDFLPMAKAIPHCTSLDVIQLTGCGLTDVCVRNLAEAVYRSPSITSVTVDFNCSAGLAAEPAARDDRELITDINVTGLQFRSGILNGLEDTLSGTMTKKDDKKKSYGGTSGPTGAKAKAAAAREAEEQERQSVEMSIPEGWPALFFNGIQHLCLRGNKISDADVLKMASYLEEPYCDLRCLNLWGNEITDVGACALAKSISNSRRLTAIDLGQNKITDMGAEAFAEIFLSSDVTIEEAQKVRTKTLTVLNTNGPIAPVVAPPLEPLPPMPTFQEIFLSNGDEGTNLEQSPSSSSPEKSTRVGRSMRGAPSKSVRSDSGGAAPRLGSGTGGRKGKDTDFSMNDRSKNDFDRDLVKLEEGKVRIPGCVQITTLSLAHNPDITDRGVLALERVLKTCEPSRSDECQMMGPGLPSHYCGTLSLRRLEIVNTNLSDSVMNKLGLALQKIIQRKQAVSS